MCGSGYFLVGGDVLKRLNVQVNNDLFDEVTEYAFKYRITRSAAVNCLLTFALEQIDFDYQLLRSNR